MSAVTDLVDTVAAVNTQLAAISALKAKLEGYRAVKQEYTAHVQDAQAELDQLMTDTKPMLRQLGDKINAAFPATP